MLSKFLTSEYSHLLIIDAVDAGKKTMWYHFYGLQWCSSREYDNAHGTDKSNAKNSRSSW